VKNGIIGKFIGTLFVKKVKVKNIGVSLQRFTKDVETNLTIELTSQMSSERRMGNGRE
jgi:hypothetical protein